jgi:hypothetical protein
VARAGAVLDSVSGLLQAAETASRDMLLFVAEGAGRSVSVVLVCMV